MKIFVINLESATDRWEHYKNDDRFTRWEAIHHKNLTDNEPLIDEMVSYWNIDPLEHRAKCACFLSHTSLYHHIVDNHLSDVLILEDDAEIVGDLPDKSILPQDGFTYFGGFSSNVRLTDGPKKVEFEEGINKIDHQKYRMLTTVAIYIPNPLVAFKMLQACEERGRPRAIDTMLKYTKRDQYVLFPAPVIERRCDSQIRKGKRNKFCNELYEWKA